MLFLKQTQATSDLCVEQRNNGSKGLVVLLPCSPFSSASTTAHSEPSEGGVGYPQEVTQPPNQKESAKKRMAPQQPPKKPPCSRKDNVFMTVALRHWRNRKFWSV